MDLYERSETRIDSSGGHRSEGLTAGGFRLGRVGMSVFRDREVEMETI